MAVVGIDLGTTNTVVAAVRDGRATALKDDLGRALLPSVVSLPSNGPPIVGYDAKELRSLDPENTVFSIKRLIGRSWESEHVQKARSRFPFELKEGPGKATLVSCRSADYTLPEISALVLERARAIAEQRLGEPVGEVVITVPANFNDLQRAATKVAARVAGLEVLRILNEPTAAALAYGFGKKGRERIAVYDFGGGTFDITLLDLSENVFEVLATAGDTFLGGDDIDIAIVDAMSEELKKKHGIDAEKHTGVREQLRLAAEKLKIDLSTRSMSKIRVDGVGHGKLSKTIDFEFSMKRSDLEKLCEPWVDRTLAVSQEALDIAGISTKDLDQILLVGGSTRIPLVRRRVSSFFGKMPQSRVNPDEVVAIGAAIQAAALENKAASLLPPETRRSSRPPAPRSQFPSAPGVTSPLARPSGTQTGLAGLRKTMPGTGGDANAAEGREPSLLTALPRAGSSLGAGPSAPSPAAPIAGSPTAATRRDMPAVRMTEADDGKEDRGPRTLMGVGEPDAGTPAAPIEKHRDLPGLAPSPRNYKTLAGVGPAVGADAGLPAVASPSPAVAAPGTGAAAAGTPFKTLTGPPGAAKSTTTPPLGAAPSAAVAPLPTTAGNIKTGPLKTLSGVGGALDEPSATRATSNSTLSKLPPLSDSRVTSTSSLSRLPGSENRSSSLPPGRSSVAPGSVTPPPSPTTTTPTITTPSAPPTSLGDDDFEEVTSIYPTTPSVAPGLATLLAAGPKEPPRRPAAERPADRPAAEPSADLPAAVAKKPAVSAAAALPTAQAPAAQAPAVPTPAAAPPAVDPFFPAALEPAPTAADGSVAFDLSDLIEHESDEVDLPATPEAVDLPASVARVDLPAMPKLSASAGLPAVPAGGVDLPAHGFAATRLGTGSVDLPSARESDHDLSLPLVSGRGAAAERTGGIELPTLQGAPTSARGPYDDLSISGFDLDELEAQAGLEADEFVPRIEPPAAAPAAPPGRGAPAAPAGRGAPPAGPPPRPAAPEADPVSLRTALGPGAFSPQPPQASFDATVLGPAAGAGPGPSPQRGPDEPSHVATRGSAVASHARTAVSTGTPGSAWERTALAGSAAPSPPAHAPSAPAPLQTLGHEPHGFVGQGQTTGSVAGVRAPLLIDVTPLSLGVETVGGYVDQLIERNSPIPCERTRTFATARDHQTLVRVRVSQGEANRFEANTVLGEVELSGLSPGPRGSVKVDVTFSLDESGMLQVAARDQTTGQRANAVLRLVGVSAAHG
ncbi:MAG TPA: Hsp70 family protein [Polyangiaceae bacterium]|nr:Hsp70 family protein [Polyangiaceae bacterium]